GGGASWIETPGQLTGLALVAPVPDEAGSFTLLVTATASEAGATNIATAIASFAVTVTPQAEAPVLSVSDVSLSEGAASVALTIGDTVFAGDDTLGNLTLSGVPAGWSLNQGTTGGSAASWIETPGQLAGLALVAPSPDR